MMRLPRFAPSLALACALAAPVVFTRSNYAADAPAPPAGADAGAVAAPAPESPVPEALRKSVSDFWHFASVARYDLAAAEAEKIAGGGHEPKEVLRAFDKEIEGRNLRVIAERRVDLDERMLAWQRVPELKEAVVKLLEVFKQARQGRAADINFVDRQVMRLGEGQRAYANAVEVLKNSGELAVPVMLRYLRDPGHRALHVPIREAFKRLELRSLNPLLSATYMNDWDALTGIVAVLGELGYGQAVPYLARLVQDKDVPPTVKAAATNALARLGVNDPTTYNVAQGFYEQAETFYNDRNSIKPPTDQPSGFIWYWNNNTLEKKDVPPAVFNEDMAMRLSEQVLKLDPNRSDAVSLWLAAGYKREAELPEGARDPFWDETHPPIHYYGTISGTKHLSGTLRRALKDNTASVAYKALRSMQEIVGTSNLFAGEEAGPIIEAMRFPDRQVRFEAAMAVAQGLPQRQFPGHERVIPILAEALSQSGKPGVVVLAPSDNELNALTGGIGGGGAYAVKGGVTAEQAVNQAVSLSGVDVIILKEGDKNLDRLIQIADGNPKLERAARLILVASKEASSFAQLVSTDTQYTLSTAKPDDAAAITAAIEEARKRNGAIGMDEKIATSYAQRSAELLAKLAISRGQVFDLSQAQATVLAALDDARPEIAKAAGNVLAVLNSRDAQGALVTKAADEKTADELKISFLKNLSNNIKMFGNQLDGGLIETLRKIATGQGSVELRSAAAEALGALNLTSDQVKTLILEQAK